MLETTLSEHRFENLPAKARANVINNHAILKICRI